MRAWCEQLSRTLPSQRIDRNGAPYLVRYFAAGWSPQNRRVKPAVYLHHFLQSDPNRQVHSHPWAHSTSLILVGGYREERCVAGVTTVREFRPGDVNVIGTTDQHRIDLLGEDCWTLFMVGAYQQPWAFLDECHP